MAQFRYLAVEPGGRRVRANIEAVDMSTARSLLRSRGLTIIQLNEAGVLNQEIHIGFLKKPKARDMSVFCRQMHSLLNSGVPVARALSIMSGQVQNKMLREAVTDTGGRVESGESLSHAMRHKDDVYPQILISLVEAGEESGALDEIFERMAIFFEKRSRIHGMIRKAMVYPSFIAVIMVAVMIIMSIVVVPQFKEMFDDLGAELPLVTRIVVGLSNVFIYGWPFIIIGLAVLIFAYRGWKSTDSGRRTIGSIKLRLPIFGSLNTKTECASFARTLATLSASGMSLPRALQITAESLTNDLYKDIMMEAKEAVEGGNLLSQTLRGSEVIPSMVADMIAIGEETGNLDEMLMKIAEYYEEESEMAAATLTAAMEPAIIVVLGVAVGFVVLALYMPMISYYQDMSALG